MRRWIVLAAGGTFEMGTNVRDFPARQLRLLPIEITFQMIGGDNIDCKIAGLPAHFPVAKKNQDRLHPIANVQMLL